MTGLRLMNELMDPATRDTVVSAHTASGNGAGVVTTVKVKEISPLPARSPKVRTDLPIPAVQSLDRKVRLVPDLREIWSYINPFMLYGRHLGFRGDFETRFAERDPKALELFESMEEVRKDAAEFMKIALCGNFLRLSPKATRYTFSSLGRSAPLHIFNFKRQRAGDFLCLSDYVLTPQNGKRDHVALFVVTAGEASASAAKRQKTRATTSNRTGCKRSRSSPRKLARSGCIAASAKTGVSPIRPNLRWRSVSLRAIAESGTALAIPLAPTSTTRSASGSF